MLLGYLKKTIKFYIFKYKYPEASIGFGSSIDKNSSIKKDFTIGTNSYISNSNIENNVNISSSCSISFSQIANNVKIDNNVNLCEVTVGRFSYISSHTTASQVAVGSFCSIGPQCLIGYGEHPTNFVSTSPVFFSTLKQCGTSFSNNNLFKERKKITIGHDVWLGARVFIKDGVTIGNGAIVGAGAVVVKNVPDYAIVGGVPAKLIRFRFSHELIQKLQIIRWWNLSEEYLQEAQSLIAQPNIQMFISWHEKNMPFDLVIKGHN